jgi:predicted enzyme related to lactoylglutathione lyase
MPAGKGERVTPEDPEDPEDPEAARAASFAHGQVCYLQMPAADATRSAAFYEVVFGWQTETPYQDFESPGLIGQWVQGRPPAAGAGPMIWIHVADMDRTLERVTAHGGQILEPPSPDGPTRVLATIIDPEGNPVGLASHALPS